MNSEDKIVESNNLNPSLFEIIHEYEETEKRIVAAAGKISPKLAQDECPLRHNHRRLSYQLFGLNYIRWECGFCGMHDEI